DVELAVVEDLLAAVDGCPRRDAPERAPLDAAVRAAGGAPLVAAVGDGAAEAPGVEEVEHLAGEGVSHGVVPLDVVDAVVVGLRQQVGRPALGPEGVEPPGAEVV